MAERDDKQFDPTPHRLQKARDDGNVFRSREIVSVAALMFGGAMLAYGTPFAFERLKGIAERLFFQSAGTELTVLSVPVILQDIGLEITVILAPLFGLLIVSGFALNVLQSGFSISMKPLAPKGNRINPVEGLKRIFSKKGLFEFLKAALKIALVAPLAYSTIKGHLPAILTLQTLPLDDILGTTGGWIITMVFQITLALLVLAVVDFIVEKRRHTNELKMSRQEVTDEAKEQEGDPQLKGKRRQLARERLRRPRLDHAVLKADVVITNPTHYAIALRYDPNEADAPTVIVKGIRKRALRIKELAATHQVPMVENRPLARALYASVDEGKQIPEELYPAVAAILAEIFRKRQSQ